MGFILNRLIQALHFMVQFQTSPCVFDGGKLRQESLLQPALLLHQKVLHQVADLYMHV